MKITILLITWICFLSDQNVPQAIDETVNLNLLLGEWKLDMSPQDDTDDNFAMMKITEIKGSSFKGEFYREGVRIRNAQTNTQMGKIYGSLISGDNSGSYNTTFYYEDGVLYGTTHAVDKKFLAVWTAIKVK